MSRMGYQPKMPGDKRFVVYSDPAGDLVVCMVAFAFVAYAVCAAIEWLL